jgi:hypothetical protein
VLFYEDELEFEISEGQHKEGITFAKDKATQIME